MGLAVVTPIQDVVDMLYDEEGELMKTRKQLDAMATTGLADEEAI